LLSDDLGANEIYAETKLLVGLFLDNPPPPDHLIERLAKARLGEVA
jgi:hypothetical protein